MKPFIQSSITLTRLFLIHTNSKYCKIYSIYAFQGKSTENILYIKSARIIAYSHAKQLTFFFLLLFSGTNEAIS